MTSASPPPVTIAPPPPPPAPPPGAGASAPAGDTSAYPGFLYDPGLVDKGHEKVRAMRQIQFDFPQAKPPEPPPQWLEELIEFIGRNSGTLQWIAYALVALIVLYVIYRMVPPVRIWVDRMLGRVRAGGEEAESEWQPELSRARELLGEADAFAAQGRYAEAVHLLLWRSIEDIGRRRPRLLRPSLTARDIARSPELPEAARGAFSTIADVVELSLFGRRPVDEAGWLRCREAYSRFALRESWAAPAASPGAGTVGAAA